MKPMALFAGLLLLTPAAMAQDEVDQRLPELVNRVQQMIADNPDLSGVTINGAAIVERRLGEGKDIRFRAEGANLEQRVRLRDAITDFMRQDPFWQTWLQTGGVEVTYADQVRDPSLVEPIQPSADEQAQIDQLLTTVQDQIEIDPRIGGALVQEATMVRRVEGPGYALQIVGRAAAEEQREIISELFTEAMAASPYWRERRGQFFINLEPIVIAPPSLERATRYFTMGVDAFFRGDQFTAERALTRAIAQAPDIVVYRWWKVLTLLARGQEARAEALLRPLLQVNPWGQYDAQIAVALDRVQGPLRWQLQQVEQRVLLNMVP